MATLSTVTGVVTLAAEPAPARPSALAFVVGSRAVRDANSHRITLVVSQRDRLDGTTMTPPSTTTTTPAAPTTTTPPSTTTTTPAAPTTTTPPSTTTTTPAAPTTTTTPPAPVGFPVGTVDSSEPSGFAPPAPNALSGFTQTYVSDFTGSSLPSGWDTYDGTPGGDPGAHFGGSSHVVVSGGLLQLETFQDPAFNGDWATGGLCQCGLPQTYGAFFVRSRVTAGGPTAVELLWPANNAWPPEIDFNENGGSTSGTTATVHYGSNNMDHRGVAVDMTQWHTWGVIWTPTSITYTVDGRVWGTVTNAAEIPSVPMTLDLQEQTFCTMNRECPSSPQSMEVDWVAEYALG